MGRGYEPKSDVSPLKKYCSNNRIRMTLKILITPLLLLFHVKLHVDNRICIENMHILANTRIEFCIKGRLMLSLKFVIFRGVTKGGRGFKANDD